MIAKRDTAIAIRRGMSPAERLSIDVKRAGADDCWIWQGNLNNWGYGRIKSRGRQVLMHRAAYALAYGDLPSDVVVRHICDNPPCCNPAHLTTGTHVDNRSDCVSRGRHMRGERAPWAKLTDALVIEARSRFHAGASIAHLAQEYGVTRATMRRAIHGLTWKHVTAPTELRGAER